MEADELYKVIKQHPFEPVRIFVSDGSSFDIKHPDQAVMSRRALYLGISGNGKGPFQDIAIIANVHITRIQPIRTRKRRRTKP